ncbi:hypothetical protein [Chamaesiphon sp. VAR_69_metabat_338]|uniref:hypothetical protein n=1 Tax=Chamaesiphon sp. VAR_69_metabat_338 TaxID=2964704 RepID=UPI00286D96DC|nr:hypothetical protein [Chamaesiphon sp. VAR_69_metabat_338]
MFDPISAPVIVRVISSAYLLSTCLLLSFTTCAWWTLSHLEHQDDRFSNWFG